MGGLRLINALLNELLGAQRYPGLGDESNTNSKIGSARSSR